MIPVGANGDRAPATAPCATMIVIRKAGMPARPATAMAIGPTRAAAAMFPAPIVASARARPKNMIGISPTLPRQHRTPRWATCPSVPLTWAWANRAVTPTSVRKSSVGNPAITPLSPMVLPVIGPRYTPITQAKTMERNPGLTAVVQLQTMTTTSATSEILARSTTQDSSARIGHGLADLTYRRGSANWSRSSRRSTLPMALRGRASTKTTSSGRW